MSKVKLHQNLNDVSYFAFKLKGTTTGALGTLALGLPSKTLGLPRPLVASVVRTELGGAMLCAFPL